MKFNKLEFLYELHQDAMHDDDMERAEIIKEIINDLTKWNS